MIQKIQGSIDFGILARLLNASFLTEARKYGLTQENCPTNNAFTSGDMLKKQFIDCREFYKYEYNKQLVGLIAIERSSKELHTYYIENLAVHPDHRHQRIGRKLMDFATARIAELGGKKISVALIDDNHILKNWYQQQGYAEKRKQTFDHLPFKVCFMYKSILKE